MADITKCANKKCKIKNTVIDIQQEMIYGKVMQNLVKIK